MYIYVYIVVDFLPLRRADGRFYPDCGRARPPNVAIQSQLSDQRRNPAPGVFFHHTTTLSMLCPRATGSIAELSIYLIIRADRLPRGCTSTGPVRKRAALSSSLRLRLPSGLLSPSPVGPDYVIGVKNQLIIPNTIMAVQWRKGRNEQVNIQTMGTFIYTRMQAMNGNEWG